MPSTSTALRVIVASVLAAALTPPQPGRHALRARPQQPGRHALRARPLAAALVETAGLVPDGARHVSEDLVKKTHRFDVSLQEPLGLTLGEAQAGKDTCVYVKTVDESGGAHAAGCRAGDRVVATSATLGDAMWPKSSIAGVVSAVRSRLQLGNQKVSLRIERSLDDDEVALAELRSRESVKERWEVELQKPLGLTLKNVDGTPTVAQIKKGGSAERSKGRVRIGDRVVGVESAFGGRMYPVTTTKEVLAAAALPTPSISLRLERDVRVGPWSGLLRSDGDDDEDAVAPRDRRSSTQSQVQRDIGDALNVYLELRRAQLPATATASLLLDRCTFLAKTYARRASSRKAFRSGRGDAQDRLDALLQTLEDAEVELSAKFATNAVSAFVSVGAPKRGARLFERCARGDPGHPRPNRRLLTAGVSAYARLGRVDQAFAAAREATTEENIDTRLGNALLAAAAAAKDVRRAEAVFAAMTRAPDASPAGADTGARLMPSFAPQPRAPPAAPPRALADAVTYRTMIDAYARAKRPDDAQAVLERMRTEAGLGPDRVASTALMKAHVEAGDVDAAERCLEELLEAADEVMERTRVLVARAAAQSEDGEAPKSLLGERAAAYRRARPDATCWNTLIRGYARTLRWRAAADCLQRMRDAGCPPDLVSYTNVATACLRADRPKEALRRLDELERARAAAVAVTGPGGRAARRLRPNVVAYTIGCLAHAKTGDLVGALLVLRKMRDAGVAPNERTCAAVLECCLKAGRPSSAMGLVEEMRASGVREDVVTSTLLLRCHLAAGEPAKASRLLDEMEASAVDGAVSAVDGQRGKRSRRSTAPNLVTYNAALAGFAKLGAWGEALDALDRAAARFAPNRETWAALAGISQDRAKGHDFLHDALRLLMRRDRAVGAKAYEAWLLAAARANDVDRVDALARARADGRLRIVVGERGARRRALDDGVRLDTDGRLDELEAAVLRSRRTSSSSSAVPAKR